VRVKDGRRLAIMLLSYPQRADLTPMATSIQSQLRPLGFDVQTQQVQDSAKALQGGDWDASMYSVNLLPAGDPLYAFNQTLVAGGDWNFGKYASPQMQATVERMRGETDPARRQALSREAQELIKADTPNAYLVASPLIYAYRKGKVRNFTPHPSDLYLIDNKISVQ
jgi:peptide/nickel transport system substrate-binding protein